MRALANYYFALLRNGKDSLPEPEPLRAGAALRDLYHEAGTVSAARAYADNIKYLDLYETELKLIDQPYGETKKAMQTMKLHQYAFVSCWGGPFFSLWCAFDATAGISIAQVGVALKAYKSIHGHYPANLNEITRSLGWKLPLDPFTKRSLSYQREGNGFMLYSCGPHPRDDKWESFE